MRAHDRPPRCAAMLAIAFSVGCLPAKAAGPAPVDGGHADGRTASSSDSASPVPDAGPPPSCGTLTACGIECVDTQTDPTSCGACGRTCVIPQGTGGCTMGECSIAACDFDYYDSDGVVENGCELKDTCVPHEVCDTACETVGATACTEGVVSCVPPPESCNGSDDNCDGQCDEGLSGCRRPIHRAHGDGHVYTDDLAFASSAPFSVEHAGFFHVYATSVPGTRPLFLCRKGNGKYFLTADTACEMAGPRVRSLGFWSPTERCGAVPLYRLYAGSTGNHFYTIHAAERDGAIHTYGYRDEGIAGWVWATP